MVETPRDLLQRFGLKPKHSWGQNFLGDAEVLERISEAALLKPHDTCVELGAGLGHLTRALLATGARVIAVERDRDMVKALESQHLKGLQLVEANAATVIFKDIAKAEQCAVVGNLPYHLSSTILFQVMEQVESVPRVVFTLQKEVVTRLAAKPGGRDYGVLTVLLNLRFKCEHVFDIPAHKFHPPPKVDSAVLRLTRLATPRAPVTDEALFRKVVKAAFNQRRKTLHNSIQSDRSLVPPMEWAQVFAQVGIDSQRRAETLSVEEFARLTNALHGTSP
jgi:16S rRNA (adenine1518-N6/adenine1519-N6)-dimethyltransferase